jgi:hypothetical protein
MQLPVIVDGADNRVLVVALDHRVNLVKVDGVGCLENIPLVDSLVGRDGVV